ncbi:MAG: hypothetical protein JNJ77_16260 [Planctomycetia bacterium]|nr:hypothetical protein [Planctomycetia bacterium]
MIRRIILITVVISLAGCSRARPEPHPVAGKVLFNGRPIADAMVTLHSVKNDVTPMPIAYTRADGQFDVSWLKQGDGAPVGEYAVTITWRQLVQRGEEKERSGRNQLPAHYADPQKTPWRCIIKPGKNVLPVHEIKGS